MEREKMTETERLVWALTYVGELRRYNTGLSKMNFPSNDGAVLAAGLAVAAMREVSRESLAEFAPDFDGRNHTRFRPEREVMVDAAWTFLEDARATAEDAPGEQDEDEDDESKAAPASSEDAKPTDDDDDDDDDDDQGDEYTRLFRGE